MDCRRRLAQFKDMLYGGPESPDSDECGPRGTGRVLKAGPVVCGLGGWRGGCSVLRSTGPLCRLRDWMCGRAAPASCSPNLRSFLPSISLFLCNTSSANSWTLAACLIASWSDFRPSLG